jgi:putative endopeptidase
VAFLKRLRLACPFAHTTATIRRGVIVAAMVLVAGLSLEALRAGQQAPGQKPSATADHGVDLSIIDKTCKPCEDFYRYASGEWLAKNPVPAAYPSWGRFNELAERNRDELRRILEDAQAHTNAAAGSNAQKIGDFYASCMDEPSVNAAGTKPLDAEFARIEKLANPDDLRQEVAHLQSIGAGALFEFGSTQDAKNSSQEIAGADQGGLGMPDRDYYTSSDANRVDVRKKYQAHVSKMLQLAGDDAAKADAEAQAIVDLETKLAAASLTRVERRDPDKTYHKLTRAELKTLTPDWSWESYFHDVGHPTIDVVDVSAPKFFEAMSQALKDTPLDTWKTYLRWHLLNSTAPYLSQEFVDEDFNFKGRVLQGTKELLPRWKRCVTATDRQLGEALGQIYAQKYFPAEAKARALDMVNHLTEALRDDLRTLPWMSPETRKQALGKLDAFARKIGYPEKWRDYSAYKVDRGPYVLNQMRGAQFEFGRDLDKIGKPVDRTEWDMTPPTVNAYYSAEMNEIVFPAGILQPPFFDPNADDASNYGAMGAVIGHEMTHGFDDEGRKFDAQGNLKDWWTPEDAKNFEQRAACVEKQFDGYVVEGELHENGKLELGESIADLGGLNLAYRALHAAEKGQADPMIGGLTRDQRFFISYAQIWAANDRLEYERLLVNTNPHPLARFRAIAAPSNMLEFARAFRCKEGDAKESDPMVRPTSLRCQIW